MTAVKRLKPVLIGIIVCELIGISGAVFTTPAIPTWYAGLTKPWFSPPNWLFGPVWTLLYLMMGAAAGLIWSEKTETGKNRAKWLFGVQLGLNFLWSMIFFGLRQPAVAFGEIILLWGTILATIREFLKINRTAAYLLIPYLAWVSFAAMLNLAVARLNF
jgi:tryptophan-rich sensory protein